MLTRKVSGLTRSSEGFDVIFWLIAHLTYLETHHVMSSNQNTLPLIGCLVALSFGAWAARASVVPQPSSDYNLIGPQNNLPSAHPNGGVQDSQGGASLTINPPTLTYSNPVNSSDKRTVTGSLTASVDPEQGSNSTTGLAVNVGTVKAQVQNGYGFPDGGAYAEAVLTQYIRINDLFHPDVQNEMIDLRVKGGVSVNLAQNPVYTDSFGNTGFWAGQSATAKLSLQVYTYDPITKELQTPGDNDGKTFNPHPDSLGPDLDTATKYTYLIPDNTWVPVYEDVIAEDGSSFDGTVMAQIDPIISLDSTDPNGLTLEITPLDFPSVPEVQPIVLICAVCIAGITVIRRSACGSLRPRSQ